jgi:hypothetical protein
METIFVVEEQLAGWGIDLDVDSVLRSQGGDPAALRVHNPRLTVIAEKAISEGAHLIKPSVQQIRCKVKSFKHQNLHLENGHAFSGSLISRHMAPAEEVVAAIMTIGPELETYAAQVIGRDAALGLALDALGTAAVESLSHAICSHVDTLAREADKQTTIPISPGMIGWPVDQGQSQLFALWDGAPLPVKLTDRCMMVPAKSLSMLIGVGREVQYDGMPCDYCSENQTCRYKKHDG